VTIDTRQQLLAQINSQITLNGTGAITGPILNNILDTIVNSSLFSTGVWSQYTSYAPLDIVTYSGATYIAIVPNVNQVPPNTTYWSLFSSTSGGTGNTIYTVTQLANNPVTGTPSSSTYLRGDGTWAVGSGGGGGAQGGGVVPSTPTYTDQVFFVNSNVVQSNFTLPANDNAGSFGPITINAGVTVTIPASSTWSIV
jgi:hypothetical protein